MPRKILLRKMLPAILLALLLVTPAAALDWGRSLLGGVCWPNCVRKTCCDDYQPKPLPCAVPWKRFCCDDYCPKPLPCAVPVKPFCCDDYCPKPLPPITCPPCADLKCPPPLPCQIPCQTVVPGPPS
jgi:hypothetical protein